MVVQPYFYFSLITWRHWVAVVVYLMVIWLGLFALARYALPLGKFTALMFGSYFHLFCAVITYLLMRYGSVAPYGRYIHNTTVYITVSAPLSWAIQECPTLLNVIYYLVLEYPCYALNYNSIQWIQSIFWGSLEEKIQIITLLTEGFGTLQVGLFFFVIHYTHRSFLYPLRIRDGTPVPLHITVLASVYCLFNGRLQLLANVRYTPFVLNTNVVDSTHYTVLFWIASFVFFLGMFVNVSSDYYLLNLKSRPPKCTRKIPRGGLFEYVSCPNFFGEIVEWCAYTIIVWSTALTKTKIITGEMLGITNSWMALPAFSFFVYVLANLLPRGYAHHSWYKKHFGKEYDLLQRRAVIPYLY